MNPHWPRQLMALMMECRCLRVAQVCRWAALRHGVDEADAMAVIHRLRANGTLSLDGGHVMLPYRRPAQKLIAAFDALLQLAGKTAENITAASPTALLRFTTGTGESIRFFSIAWGKPGQSSGPNHRWIVLLEDAHQRPPPIIPPDCYYALPVEAPQSGQFRFFK